MAAPVSDANLPLQLKEIEESRGSSTIILKWAESIRIWMPTTNNEEDGESKGDILARVKGKQSTTPLIHPNFLLLKP